MATQKSKPSQTPEASTLSPGYPRLSTELLDLDVENPRLADVPVPESPTQDDLASVLWEAMAVRELALSIAYNGYFSHEPLFVEKAKGGRYVVIEGNRRLTAVRVLLDPRLRKRLKIDDLPPVSSARRKELESLPCLVTTRQECWQYLGFRHINGPATWGAYAKAQYIARVKDEFGVSLDDIATHIGDTHSTVLRQYHGLMVVEQAEQTGEFSRNDIESSRFSFSHIYTGLSYPGFQKYLKLEGVDRSKKRPVPRSHEKKLAELCRWIYGSKSRGQMRVIRSQNPDLRLLDTVLQSNEAVEALRSGLPLNVAYEVGLGDEHVFRRALHDAKDALQKASATVVTGYDGDRGLHTLASDIETMAIDLVSRMASQMRARKRRDS